MRNDSEINVNVKLSWLLLNFFKNLLLFKITDNPFSRSGNDSAHIPGNKPYNTPYKYGGHSPVSKYHIVAYFNYGCLYLVKILFCFYVNRSFVNNN